MSMMGVRDVRVRDFEGKWYIEVDSEDLGRTFLLDDAYELPIPVTFSTEKEAEAHKKQYIKKLKRLEKERKKEKGAPTE